jgi:hypothetical protein
VLDESRKPVPNLRHSLTDAMALMAFIDDVRNMAVSMESYPFGALPALLRAMPPVVETKVFQSC